MTLAKILLSICAKMDVRKIEQFDLALIVYYLNYKLLVVMIRTYIYNGFQRMALILGCVLAYLFFFRTRGAGGSQKGGGTIQAVASIQR